MKRILLVLPIIFCLGCEDLPIGVNDLAEAIGTAEANGLIPNVAFDTWDNQPDFPDLGGTGLAPTGS